MNLTKVYTRKATLLERDLICQVVMKGRSSVPEVFYTYVANASADGIVDIYGDAEDVKDNETRVLQASKENKDYVGEKLENGLEAVRALGNLPLDLPEKIESLSAKQITAELLNLKEKLVAFSGYFDFTHVLGAIKVEMDESTVHMLGEFHEIRKQTFENYFSFLKTVCTALSKKFDIDCDLESLTFEELLNLVQGNLSMPIALVRIRERDRYVLIVTPENTTVVSSSEFDDALQKITNQLNTKDVAKIAGIGVFKGIVRGKVRKIDLTTKIETLEPGTVIVTAVTQPEMTPFLKNAVAVVTDEGGLLCHAANVAREFKIPTVVGTKNATKVLHDGDVVEVDSEKGIVRIIF